MTVKLGSLISEYSVRNKADEDIPVYSVTNEQGFCAGYFSKEVASQDRTTYKIVPRGCFAYNPSRINVGSVDIQECEDRVIVSPLYVVFSVDEKLNSRYLLHYLKSDITLTFIKAYASGSVRDNLKFSILKDFPINLPSVEEQEQIVATLDGIEHLIELRKEEIASLEKLVKSRFIELFGDPKSNPKGYPQKQLGKSCKVTTGNTPSRAVAEYYGDHIEWIKTDNIVSGLISPTTATEYLSEKGMIVGRTVESGSILMACIAGSVSSIGRVCVTNRKVAFNQQINAIVPYDYNVLFLYAMLQLSKEYLVDGINMALKGILSKSKLEEKSFFVPPIELQEQFASFVEQADKSKLAVQKALDELEILKKSLMQQYFG